NSPPAVVSWGSYRLDIFALGTDNQMYHKNSHFALSLPGPGPGPWYPSQTAWDEPLGGVFNSQPAVVSRGVGSLDMFALGTDNPLYNKAGDGESPSQASWEALGGVFNSQPAAVARGSNRVDIFALGTDNQMYHKAWDGAWHPSQTDWEPLGGVFDP